MYLKQNYLVIYDILFITIKVPVHNFFKAPPATTKFRVVQRGINTFIMSTYVCAKQSWPSLHVHEIISIRFKTRGGRISQDTQKQNQLVGLKNTMYKEIQQISIVQYISIGAPKKMINSFLM